MFTQISAAHYRCLDDVVQSGAPFHVLVGPNGSGKSTFLDVLLFLTDFLREGLESALTQRSPTFDDLLFAGRGPSFQLAIEAEIPVDLRSHLAGEDDFGTIRYELEVGFDDDSSSGEVIVLRELLRLVGTTVEKESPDHPKRRKRKGATIKRGTIVTRNATGEALLHGEQQFASRFPFAVGVHHRFGRQKSAFANIPEDESQFPITTWLKNLLFDGVQGIVLDSLAMRKASPPGRSRSFRTDGSNLPWVVEDLANQDSDRFADWIAHLKTALPDLEGIRTVLRADDKHRYLILQYAGGLEVPSWMASDGTLRLLALTLPAYLPDFRGVYLIEEPENGIHPLAIETMFQSISNVYDAQIFVATHSPIILGLAELDQVLCFRKNEQGATEIVQGSEHPALRDWKGETDLGILFAGGVLG